VVTSGGTTSSQTISLTDDTTLTFAL
jgi:hypothetical protein